MPDGVPASREQKISSLKDRLQARPHSHHDSFAIIHHHSSRFIITPTPIAPPRSSSAERGWRRGAEDYHGPADGRGRDAGAPAAFCSAISVHVQNLCCATGEFHLVITALQAATPDEGTTVSMCQQVLRP